MMVKSLRKRVLCLLLERNIRGINSIRAIEREAVFHDTCIRHNWQSALSDLRGVRFCWGRPGDGGVGDFGPFANVILNICWRGSAEGWYVPSY